MLENHIALPIHTYQPRPSDIDGSCFGCGDDFLWNDESRNIDGDLYCLECVENMPICPGCDRRIATDAVEKHWLDMDTGCHNSDFFHAACWPTYRDENNLVEKERV